MYKDDRKAEWKKTTERAIKTRAEVKNSNRKCGEMQEGKVTLCKGAHSYFALLHLSAPFRSQRLVPTQNEVPVEKRQCIFCRLVHKEIHLSLAQQYLDFHVGSGELVLRRTSRSAVTVPRHKPRPMRDFRLLPWSSGKFSPTFQDNISVPSSELNVGKLLPLFAEQ